MDESEKILSELNAAEFSASAADAEALPFETLEDFSTAPLTLAETAEAVRQRTEYFFGLTVKYNRRSANYLEACAYFEKGVKYLGSCCLTLELLRQKKVEAPEIEGLSTHWLYGMVSFNVRKLNAAVDEFITSGVELPGKWLDMQFRFLNLAERLKATEHRIYSCWGHPDPFADKVITRSKLFTKDAANKRQVQHNVKPPVFRAPASLPVKKEAVREALGGDAEIRISTVPGKEAGRREAQQPAALPAPEAPDEEIRAEETQEAESGKPEAESGKPEANSRRAEESRKESPESPKPVIEIRVADDPAGTIWEGIDPEKEEAIRFFETHTIAQTEELRIKDPERFYELRRKAFQR